MYDLTFTIDAQGTTTPLTLAIDQAVVAGWTGDPPYEPGETSRPDTKGD